MKIFHYQTRYVSRNRMKLCVELSFTEILLFKCYIKRDKTRTSEMVE